MKYSIDAKDKKLGRVASQAAAMLMGKNNPAFTKNAVAADKVEIVNASAMDIDARKKTSDIYVTYTGHRGGLNSESLGALIDRRGMGEVMRRAVRRMLPNNKLRDRRMRNLMVKE